MSILAFQTCEVHRSTRASRIALPTLGLVVIAIASMPWWGGRSDIRLAVEILYILALAQTWNLLAGFGGLVSIGHQAFIGLGGYAMFSLALFAGVNPFIGVFLAGLAAALVAVPTVALVFRLKGAYFAVGTWVVAEVFRLAVANMSAVGGGSGISITKAVSAIPAWQREATTLWIALAIGVGSVLVVYLLLRSRIGLALTALRDSEVASAAMGIRVRNLKFWVFVTSAFGCGLIGALIFLTKLRISPDAAFSVDWTAVAIFIVVIGGIGTIEGPIIGTLIYFALRTMLSDFGSVYLITLGALAILVMLKAPRGIWGWVVDHWDLHFFPVQRRITPKEPAHPQKDAAVQPATTL